MYSDFCLFETNTHIILIPKLKNSRKSYLSNMLSDIFLYSPIIRRKLKYILNYCSKILIKCLKPIFHCDAKTLAFRPPTRNFALGIPICWYLKTLKFACPPMRNPNTDQWNIGCIGSPGVGACVRHVHFMLLVSILFALGGQSERSFQ